MAKSRLTSEIPKKIPTNHRREIKSLTVLTEKRLTDIIDIIGLTEWDAE